MLGFGITGLALPTSIPGELLRRWRQRAFHLVVSDHILEEVGRALATPYFQRRLTPEEVAGAVELLRRKAELVSIAVPVVGVATRPEDDRVLAAAISANVDALVTGDRQLLHLQRYRRVAILSPRTFLALLDRAAPGPGERGA